jgi:hypothetical protein
MAFTISRMGHARLRPQAAAGGRKGARIAHSVSASFHSVAPRGDVAVRWSASRSLSRLVVANLTNHDLNRLPSPYIIMPEAFQDGLSTAAAHLK